MDRYSSSAGQARPSVPVPKQQLLRDEMREVWKEFRARVGDLRY